MRSPSAARRMGGCQRRRAGKVTSLGRQDGDRATGEAAQGPTAAAIANALANATGHRLRELPFTRARIKAAIGV